MNKTLLTDLYQLTMDAAYADNGKDDTATFELFVRKLPANWGYYIANGIEEAIDYITTIKADTAELEKLRERNILPESYIEQLKSFKFEGDVHALKEGTPFFPEEPVMRVTAKRSQAQFIETTLLNIINFQTMIATKANRVVNAAREDKGREAKIVDFGLRRAQGEDAGMKGARAAYIAGAAGTSNVKAGLEYGLPIVGTHAHSFVMSFPSELEAFRAYTKTFPDNATLLIDTYDTVEGAQNAAIVAKELEFQGHRLGAVRLDSGDLADLSKKVRRLLDDEGLQYVRIVASNDLNENKIAELVSRGAPIDAYGVGTEMITAKPVAAIPGVYKIVEDNDGGKMKHSTGKKSHPGKHQVYRMEKRGAYTHDVIALEGESIGGKPLLEQVIKDGARVRPIPTLNETREHVRTEVAKFHHSVRDIGSYRPYDVKESDGLQRLTAKLTAKHLYTPEELALSYA